MRLVLVLAVLAAGVAFGDEDGSQVLHAAKPDVKGDPVEKYPVACTECVTVVGEAPSLLPDGHKFKLAWSDEFNGGSLDTSKWGYRTNFWGRRAHWFAAPEDGCVEVKDGLVRLKVKKLPNGQFVSPQLQTGGVMWDVPPMDNPKGFWWLGKREKPKFEHVFGYYECRFRLQRMPVRGSSRRQHRLLLPWRGYCLPSRQLPHHKKAHGGHRPHGSERKRIYPLQQMRRRGIN